MSPMLYTIQEIVRINNENLNLWLANKLLNLPISSYNQQKLP